MSSSSHIAHQFDDSAQQREAATLGMWAFLATEVMFFGGALVAYAVYRARYPEGFILASQLENWKIGAFNTGVLLCSSLAMALAVYSAHHGNRRGIIGWLAATIVLACMFLGVKAYEYTHLYHEGLIPSAGFDQPAPGDKPHFPAEHRSAARIFYSLYFALTGIHALHMVIGIGLMLWLIGLARRGRFSGDYYNPVEMTGLYWHFVDIVWIFLYPLLYLISPI
jgi:cytochrome c oxidase subunit III